MNKEQFKEDYFFKVYKDERGLHKRKLEQLTGIDCRNLYTRIQNYQIQTYGTSLAYISEETIKFKKGKSVVQRVRKQLNDKMVYEQNKMIKRNSKERGN